MKTIRTGVYALLQYQGKYVLIKKGRGPFSGLYDLPGGKIEHGEIHREALLREIQEEVGISKEKLSIKKLLTVEEVFVQHEWNGKQKDEHIIAIIYLVGILSEKIHLNYKELGGDADGLILAEKNDLKLKKTQIADSAMQQLGRS